MVVSVEHFVTFMGHFVFLFLTRPSAHNKNFPYHVRTTQVAPRAYLVVTLIRDELSIENFLQGVGKAYCVVVIFATSNRSLRVPTTNRGKVIDQRDAFAKRTGYALARRRESEGRGFGSQGWQRIFPCEISI